MLLNRLSLSGVILLLSFNIRAGTSVDSDWQWSGFFSQGWTISDRNNFYGNSSDSNGSLNYRELGLNGTYRVSNELRASGQLLSRWAGNVDDGDPQVDYLFADWSFMQQAEQQAGMRVGRVKNPIGFYNDTRDVAFTRPSIILPQSIYLDRVRELELSSDGLGLYYNIHPGYGSWLFDFVWGEPQTDSNSEYTFLGRDWRGRFSDSELSLFRAMYEHDGGRIRLGVTYIDATAHFDAAPADLVTDGDIEFDLVGYSAQYNFEYVSFTTEYVIEDIEWINLGMLFPDRSMRTEAFYLQMEYRLSNRWTLITRYDEVIVDKNDSKGTVFQATTGLPAHTRFAKDWTLGVSYQVTPRLQARAELHHVSGTAWLPPQDNPDSSALQKRWNMLLVQASYRF